MDDILRRIEKITAKKVVNTTPVEGGYTPALRLHVELIGGETVFAKIGTTNFTSEELRKESRFYHSIDRDFMPKLVGWDDLEPQPILILEDLSDGFWPPPWTEIRINQMMNAVKQISSTPPPPHLPKLAEFDYILDGWKTIANDPEPFLSLGLTSKGWLDQVLPRLTSINGKALVDGDALLHLDLRSDNMCFVDERAICVDWNFACIGNPEFDIAFWIPSLMAEGGSLDITIHPEIVAIACGFFASRAGLPNIPDAPHVRHIQLVQLKEALPWMIRSLNLPEPSL